MLHWINGLSGGWQDLLGRMAKRRRFWILRRTDPGAQ